jgi:hypothetical protein
VCLGFRPMQWLLQLYGPPFGDLMCIACEIHGRVSTPLKWFRGGKGVSKVKVAPELLATMTTGPHVHM